jgi:tyrosine-specific transport protein
MRIIHSLGHVVGGTLLIAGTTIGVGMLALPVATGPGGFIPSMAIYLACWAFMLCTGLLLIEVSLWLPKDTSFISMAEKILGPAGRAIFWVLYLFLFVTVMIAHAAGGGEVLLQITGWNIPDWAAVLLYSGALAPVVYLGAHTVDRMNMVLISCVAVCYVAFIAFSIGHVDFKLLEYANWGKAWVALPVLFTAFTYQVIIPTLMTYMDRNVRKVRLAILFGTCIPLAIYLLWEFVILGIVSTDGLIEAGRQGQNAIGPLKEVVPRIFEVGKYFAFFALTTSFIPFALSFFDFLADGLKWEKKGARRVILCAVMFGIPIAIAIVYPNIFLIALGYAGGISCAFLFGLMPPVLAWVGRYIKRYPQHEGHQLPGGKAALIGLMIFAVLILVGEVIQQVT